MTAEDMKLYFIPDAIATMAAGIDFFVAKTDDDGHPNLGWELVFNYLGNEVSSPEHLRWLTTEAIKGGVRDIAGLHALTLVWRARIAQELDTQEFDKKLAEWKREMRELSEAPQARIASSSEVYERLAVPESAFAVPAPPRKEQARSAEREKLPLRDLEQQLKEQAQVAPRRSEEEQQRLLAELQQQLKIRTGSK